MKKLLVPFLLCALIMPALAADDSTEVDRVENSGHVLKEILNIPDNIPQDLLLRAVKKHAKETWMVPYIERWLKAPVQEEDAQLVPREKGTPQSGVITP